MIDSPERDLFLLKEISDETSDEIIKNIIKINVFDAEQEKKLVDYKRNPIRLHICTPRGKCSLWTCNMRPN